MLTCIFFVESTKNLKEKYKIVKMHFSFVFIVAITLAKISTSQGERITAFKELKIVNVPDKTINNKDVDFYLTTMEKMDKLTAEAEDIRDTYRDLMRSIFGITFTTERTKEKNINRDADELAAPRKAVEGWVRAPSQTLTVEKINHILNIPDDE